MYYLSQSGETLVKSEQLSIKNGTDIYAILPDGKEILLAEYGDEEAAREALRSVCDAITDSEDVFKF